MMFLIKIVICLKREHRNCEKKRTVTVKINIIHSNHSSNARLIRFIQSSYYTTFNTQRLDQNSGNFTSINR